MKVAVVGCGALGSFYGARLWRAGLDVHFVLRSDFDVVRRDGVRIEDAEAGFVARPKAHRDPGEVGECDWVIIGLKATANDALQPLVRPLAGRATAVLTLQNGLGNEERLAEFLPAPQILGGLCFVCLNRVAPGVVRHIAHGRIEMGEFRREPEERTHRLAEWFRGSGIECDVVGDLEQAHWQKLVWNVPFNGVGVAACAGYDAVIKGDARAVRKEACLTTDRLLADPRWERLVRELMREVIRSAQARGLAVPDAAEEEMIAKTRSMGAYRPSTLVDFERGQALELETLFMEPLRLAREAGVEAPRLAGLCAVLSALDRERAKRGGANL